MATDGKTPPPCDQEIFEKGEPVLFIRGSSNAVERWVKKVAAKANARIDWHYSGGIAQVLHLGDKESHSRVIKVAHELESELSGTIFRYCDETSEEGLYRKDVTQTPKGTIASFYNGGGNSSYIIEDEKDH